MKTMQLKDLLERVSKLPWKPDGVVLGKVAMPPGGVLENQIYAAHAANTLPVLVRALEGILSAGYNNNSHQLMKSIAGDALAAAQTVKMEGE